jgi:hypothetical protein
MQSSQRDINKIWQHLSEAVRCDSDEFPYPRQVFLTDKGKRSENLFWGQGVVVRNMDDGLTHDIDFHVVPGTFWHDDIWPPNQIYPWGANADADHPTARGTNIITGDGHGAWLTPTLAVAIGPEHFNGDNGIFNHPDLQDADWIDGVWYAHDSNSCDKRAKAQRGKNDDGTDFYIYDAPNAYADIVTLGDGERYQFQLNTEKKGSGHYDAGNPANPDFKGGGTGMHMKYSYSESQEKNSQEDWQINGYMKGGLAAESLFCNLDCEIDYHTWNEYTKGKDFEAVANWHGWITRFSDAAIKQLGEPVSAWAADLAIGWMNNPRPMITLQNALWVYREFWCNNDSTEPKIPNSFAHYWGWNEIPFTRTQITNKDNWTCFIIVLPPCEDTEITLSKWLDNNKDNSYCVSNLVEQLNKYIDYGLEPNSSQVLVVKQIPVDIEVPPYKVWRRWFFTEQVEIGGGWKIGQNGVIQKC